MTPDAPHHNFGFDLLRATEAAALTAGRWMGKGQAAEADRTITASMLTALNTLDMQGRIIVSEEGKGTSADPATPQTWMGQTIGTGNGPLVDVVFDAVDGRSLLARGASGVVSVVAAAPHNTLWSPAPARHMEKIVVDPEVAPALVPECMDAPAAWTLALVARVKRKKVSDLTVFVLDRPRHADLINEIRAAGARVMIRADGDIAGSLLACLSKRNVDLLMGVGGAVEGLISACAVRAVGGGMLGRLVPLNAEEKAVMEAAQLDRHRILTVNEMATHQNVFFVATGITEGPLLTGVQFDAGRVSTNSLILRGETQTHRRILTEHALGVGAG